MLTRSSSKSANNKKWLFLIGHTHNDCGPGGEPWIVNHFIQFIFDKFMGGDGGEPNIAKLDVPNFDRS
jgi:hypothetical protein